MDAVGDWWQLAEGERWLPKSLKRVCKRVSLPLGEGGVSFPRGGTVLFSVGKEKRWPRGRASALQCELCVSRGCSHPRMMKKGRKHHPLGHSYYTTRALLSCREKMQNP